MSTLMKIRNRRQRGLTMIATLLVLIIVAFVVLIAFKVVPIYIEYFNIRRAIEGLKTDISLNNSTADVRRGLEYRWAIDYITAVDFKDIKVRKKGGKLLAELKYEDRRSLLGNLDVVAKFDDTIQLAP